MVMYSYAEEVSDLLLRYKPASILILGPEAEQVSGCYRAQRPQCTVDVVDGPEVSHSLRARGRYDFAFASGVLERLPTAAASEVISRLRDLHARRFALVVPIGERWWGTRSVWQHIDLVAHGLSLRSRYRDEGRPLHLYTFDIENYKITPDWLNAKYWAHPENYGRYRW